jgi:hypothetical protein
MAREACHAGIVRQQTRCYVTSCISIVFRISGIAPKKLDGKLIPIESHKFVGGARGPPVRRHWHTRPSLARSFHRIRSVEYW